MTLKSGKSSFRVVNVYKSNGCPTKFPKENRYESSNPEGAARKAFTQFCNRKKIRGQCSLFIEVENTTNNHINKGKTYIKKLNRYKLDDPIVRFEGTPQEYSIEYGTRVKSVKSVSVSKGVVCKKSSGRMKRKSRRGAMSSSSSSSSRYSTSKKRKTRRRKN